MRCMPSYIHEAYLIDAFPLYCDGYEQILNSISKKTRIVKCHHLRDIEHLNLSNNKSNVAIIDIWSFGAKGLEFLIDLRIKYPHLQIILSADTMTDKAIAKYHALGIDAVLSKKSSLKSLTASLCYLSLNQEIYATESEDAECYPLNANINQQLAENIITRKELMTLRYLMQGLINKDIAKKMGVCESTTKSHVSSLIRKFGVINRTQIIKEFRYQGRQTNISHHYKKQRVVAISEARKLLAKGLVQVEDIQVVI